MNNYYLYEYLFYFIESIGFDGKCFEVKVISGKTPPYRKIIFRNESFSDILLDICVTMGL